jgi:DNA-directed RNA polymerase subunit RPC12/RpoP
VLLQCAHCGAPLDVREGSAIVKCGYCGFKTERTRLVMLSHETPAGFAPPQVWRPPPHVPAASNVELKYAASSASSVGCVIAGVVALALIGPAIGIFATLQKKGGLGGTLGGGPKLEEVAGKEIAGTASELSKRLGGGRIADKSLYVSLSDPRFDQLYFLWNEAELSYPYYVGSIMRNGKAVPSGTCDRLAAMLGEFRNNSWSLGDAYVSCDPAGSISVYTTFSSSKPPDESDAWKEKVALLYRLEMDALLDREPTVTRKDLRKVIGAGFLVADLAKVDLDVDIDGAKAMLGKALGGTAVTSDGYSYEIMVADSPLPRVSFRWDNQKGGRLSSIGFSTSGWQPLEKAQAKVAGCLKKTLGEPVIDESDHVKRKVNYRFKEYAVYLSDSNMSLSRPTKAIWTALVKGLDGCKG